MKEISDTVKRVVLPFGVTLYQGDCLEILPTLSGINAVVTDPPYGKGYHSGGVSSISSNKWKEPSCDKWKGVKIIGDEQPETSCIPLIKSAVVEGGAIYLCSQWMVESDWITALLDADLKVRNRLIWVKPVQGCGDLQTTFGPMHESILFAAKGRHELRGKREGDVWVEKVGVNGCFRKGLVHPCQKPVPLMGWLIEKSTTAGDTVLDPYMGSGSTIIAAIRTGRKAIGIEKDPEHFEAALNRIKEELAQGDLFRQDDRELKETTLFPE